MNHPAAPNPAQAAGRAPVTHAPATYADVLAAPETMVAELIDGRLYLQPRTASPHAYACSGLAAELVGPFQKGRGGPGDWWIVIEPELHFGAQVLVPDLAGWRRERMPVYPSVPFFDLAPDWVCEILSPSTRRLDLGRKRDVYAEHGVGHLWLVDPEARTLEAFALTEAGWLLLATVEAADPVSLAPYDAVTFALSELWPPEG